MQRNVFSARRISGLVAALALTAAGCRGYYPAYKYSPSAEVHEIHLPEQKDGTVRVAAHLVGILRPADGATRRLHVRMQIDNQQAGPVAILLSQCAAVASSTYTMAAEEGAAAVELAAGERRSIEVLFALPSPAEMPNTALDEIELRVPLRIGERAHETRITFQRGRARGAGPWPRYHGFYDGYWGPWVHGHWWWHHSIILDCH